MPKLHISSYYHLGRQDINFQVASEQLESLDGIVQLGLKRKSDEESHPQQYRINVSKQNLIILEKKQQEQERLFSYHSEFKDFLTALACDMETAIEEQQLISMATFYGFEVTSVASSRHPTFNYLESPLFTGEGVQWPKESCHQQDVFVINTHGRKQELDGPYQQAVESAPSFQRVVIDACSSALGGFPIVKSGNNSPLELLLDGFIARYSSSNEPLENIDVIGFTTKYTPDDHNLIATAVFGSPEMVSDETRLLSKNPADRKRQIEDHNRDKESARAVTQRNLFETECKRRNSLDIERDVLKRALIKLASQTASTYLHKTKYNSTSGLTKVLWELSGENNTLEKFCEAIEKCIPKKQWEKNILIEYLKSHRLIYIDSINKPDALIDKALSLINAYVGVLAVSKDIRDSIKGVEEAIAGLSKQNNMQTSTTVLEQGPNGNF